MCRRKSLNREWIWIHRIDSEIKNPFEFEGQNIELRASIGYALFSEAGIELEVLIEKADKSMYEVKREKRTRKRALILNLVKELIKDNKRLRVC